MTSPLPPRDARAPRRGRAPILLLAAAAPVIGYLLLRPATGDGEARRIGAAAAAHEAPRYENRGLWRSPKGSTKEAAPAPIWGTVYDETGRALEGVVVSATTFAVAGNQNHVAGRATSDVRGRFELRLADGSYSLSAGQEGLGATVALAHSGDDVGLVLARNGAVFGTVTDERGEPITRFTIDVIGPSPDDMAASAPFVSQRFESPDGSFRITQLPDRSMYVRAVAEGHAPAVSDQMKLDPGDQREIALTMSSGCVVTGIVEDESGDPLADVLVDADLRKSAAVLGDTAIEAASTDLSDEGGSFRLEHVPPGDVLVRAYHQDYAPSTASLTIARCEDGRPVRLRMSAGSGLRGRVLGGDGAPIAGARLVLTSRVVGFVNAFSDAEGRYRFDRLPGGRVRVEAHRGTERAQAQLSLDDGEIAERDLVFSSRGDGEIRGRVTASGKPLSGIQLLVLRSAGGGLLSMFYPVTGEDGTYRVTGLGDGLYAVLVSSRNLVSAAHVEHGAAATVDLDVAKTPAIPPLVDSKGQDEDGESP